VGESVQDPKLYFENNTQKGIALIGSLQQAGVRRFVFPSTCAIYGEPDVLPIKEESRQWPTTPYGWSRLFLERLLDSYYFNAAGVTKSCGEDHEPQTHLIANALRAAPGKQSDLCVFGNTYATADGTAIRDYIPVSYLAEAHALAMQNLLGWVDRQSDLPTLVQSAWEWHLQHPQGYATT
jgi:UDP-glucose 4-epimerase